MLAITWRRDVTAGTDWWRHNAINLSVGVCRECRCTDVCLFRRAYLV